MKPSFYNIHYTETEGNFVVNTLRGSIIKVTHDEKIALLENKLEYFRVDEIIKLKESGFIVDSDFNELEHYLNKYESRKHQPGKLQVQLFLAKSCNLSCPYCYQQAFNKPVNIISEEYIFRFTLFIKNQIINNSVTDVDINLFGGEPLLARSKISMLFESLDWLSEKYKTTITYSIVTNGTLLNDEIIKELVKRKIWTQITIDGPRELHDARRQWKSGKGSFDQIIESVSKIIASGGAENLLIRVNIDKKNLHHLSLLLETLNTIGVINVECGLIEFKNQKNDYEAVRLKDAHDEIWVAEMEVYKQLKRYGYHNSPVDFTLKTVCSLHKMNSFVFDTKLRAFKCDMLIEEPKYSIGHISKDGELIVSGDEYEKQTSRKPTDFSSCSTCRYLPVCGSGCAIKSLNTKGDLHSNYCEESYHSMSLKLKSFIASYEESVE